MLIFGFVLVCISIVALPTITEGTKYLITLPNGNDFLGDVLDFKRFVDRNGANNFDDPTIRQRATSIWNSLRYLEAEFFDMLGNEVYGSDEETLDMIYDYIISTYYADLLKDYFNTMNIEFVLQD